jgi:hypothetical protein
MIKRIKEYFAKKEQLKKQTAELQKMQKYYEGLRHGALFIQAIQNDLKKQGTNINRHQRRRFEKTLVKGEFSPEMVEYYKNNIEKILIDVDKKLNPEEVKEVDGKDFYEEAKREK